MTHKFAIGAEVYYDGKAITPGLRGAYKVMRQLPVERDARILYRIKHASEAFERTVEEDQLRRL